MELHVECRPNQQGDLEPTEFVLGERTIQVMEILDRWIAVDHSYFKIKGSDSFIYLLRFAPSGKRWELTLFQARAGLDFSGQKNRLPV